MLYNRVYSQTTLKKYYQEDKFGKGLFGFIDSLKEHGTIYLTTQDCPFRKETSQPLVDQKYIQSFTFIACWAQSVLKDESIMELDASFKGVSPYVYAIPLVIIHNESIPIGFTVGISENSNLYQVFWDSLKKMGFLTNNERIQAISDNHTCWESSLKSE